MRMENTRTWQLPGKADHLSVPVISITKILTFRLLEDSINKFRISKSDGNSIRCKDIVSCKWKCGNACQFVPLPTPGSMSHPFHSNHPQRTPNCHMEIQLANKSHKIQAPKKMLIFGQPLSQKVEPHHLQSDQSGHRHRASLGSADPGGALGRLSTHLQGWGEPASQRRTGLSTASFGDWLVWDDGGFYGTPAIASGKHTKNYGKSPCY